ncbi:hypothetical protein D9M70_491950 [compost metagenome]
MYFLAMEITRRRLASTISFFARRALASPMDMRRLMSLISAMVRLDSVCRSASFCWQRWISACRLPMASAYLALPLARSADQVSLTSLPGNRRRKSARGMRASRTHSCMMARSWARTRSRAPRTWLTRASYCFGTSLIGMNSSARPCSSAMACLLSRPCFFSTLRAFSSCSDTAVKRRAASSGSGPPSPSLSSSSEASASSSSSSSLAGAALPFFSSGTGASTGSAMSSSGSM